MNVTLPTTRGLVGSAAIALLTVVLVGCAPAGSGGSPTPSSTTPAESTEPSQSTPSSDGSGIRITCFYPDGTEVGTFSRLEEAWASTNYVRIDSCEATASGDGELSEEQQAVADVAAADLPGVDPTDAYLATVAACVRLNADDLAGAPSSVLEATTLLCPEAPQAGLIQDELAARGSG
ncbi:hypothetical protein ACWEOH_09600 [Agromyces sp. NPDC004153]